MANLDGKEPITPTAFDAHEQIVRQPHTHTADKGYQAILDHDPDEVVEFPKVVAVNEETREPVIVKSAEEEKAYLEATKDPAKSE